ncbi:MAG: pseudouridine synthase [bacterium]
MERLQKVIANYGYASRREAEKLISNKKVYVNGELITEMGYKVTFNDTITIDGVVINKEANKKYYLLNKPRNVVSTASDDLGRITVVDLINTEERIYPVGRLDYDTTGVLFLTNDGDFANYLTHPSNKIRKTYLAKLEGVLDKTAIDKLKEGIFLNKRRVAIVNFKVRKKDKVKNTTMIEISIEEGRNHIVKKVFEKLGFPVIKLTRTYFGDVNIGNLQSGEYRELSIKEVRNLMKNSNNL